MNVGVQRADRSDLRLGSKKASSRRPTFRFSSRKVRRYATGSLITLGPQFLVPGVSARRRRRDSRTTTSGAARTINSPTIFSFNPGSSEFWLIFRRVLRFTKLQIIFVSEIIFRFGDDRATEERDEKSVCSGSSDGPKIATATG